MNKTTKGGLAAASAAALLLGGAGSLAYWTSSATLNGGSVNSGYLTLTAGACDATWKYATSNPNANPANAVGSAVTLFVPGDQITKNCTFTIAAKGDNLSATPTVPATLPVTAAPIATGGPAAASFSATAAATYTLTPAGGGTATALGGKITSANDGQTLTAKIVVTIPRGTDETGNPKVNTNDTQRINAALSALTVTLTQDAF